MDADDGVPTAGPAVPVSDASTEVIDAAAPALTGASDDRMARRAALRDLAAMIGEEVFY